MHLHIIRLRKRAANRVEDLTGNTTKMSKTRQR